MNDLSLLKTGILLDTGPLLLLAFNKYSDGRYLQKVKADIIEQDVKSVALTMDKILSNTIRVSITPYILAEFHSIAEKGVKLNRNGLIDLVAANIELFTKLEEINISKTDILNKKMDTSMQFCFADTSLMLAALHTGMPVLTMDSRLREYCRGQNIPAFHLYHECYWS